MGRKIPVIEGAGRTGISDKTLRAWIRQGKIVGYRVGDKLLMVDADEVDQLAPGPSQERVMPGDERGRSEESAPMQNDLAARRDQSKDATEVDHLDQVLRDYPLWVRESVRRWNRMRADGVKWEIRPIVYPKPGPWGE